MIKSSKVIRTQELHWGMDPELPTGNTLIRVYDSDSLVATKIYETRVRTEHLEPELVRLKKKYLIT